MGKTKLSVSAQSPKRGRGRLPRARQFNSEQKLAACTAALTASREHPLSIRSQEAVAAVLGESVHASTIGDWLVEYKAKALALMPPARTADEIVRAARDETIKQWSEVRKKALERLSQDAVINEAKARDLSVVAGISDDHILKATALSPTLVNAVQRLDQLLALQGIDLEATLQKLIDNAEHRLALNVTPVAREIEAGSGDEITSDKT